MFLSKKAALAVVGPHSPGFYSRLSAVPKAYGTWRPVLDLSALKLYVRRIKFRKETVSFDGLSIQEGGLGSLSGFERCLFSYPDPSAVSAVAPVCLEQHCVSVPAAPFWPVPDTLGF